MTQKEFQKLYYAYFTFSEEEAKKEARIINARGIDNDEAVVVNPTGQAWELRLKSEWEEQQSRDRSRQDRWAGGKNNDSR